MKVELDVEKYGKLVVYRNSISGGLKIYLGENEFYKDGKRSYTCNIAGKLIKAQLISTGFGGSMLKVLGNDILLSKPVKLYMFFLSLIPLIFSLVFGNVPVFAKNGFYVIGGAIGGAFGGIILACGLYISTLPKINNLRKIITILIMDALAIGFLIGISYIIVYANK